MLYFFRLMVEDAHTETLAEGLGLACVMDTLDGYLKGEAVQGLPAPLSPSPGLNIQPMINMWREIMYSDDTAIFSHCIDNSNATLRKVATWSNYSRMEFHPSKFECLR